MKTVATLIATLVAASAFAAEPAMKEEAKPAATSPAKDVKATVPAKSEAKTAPTKEAKAAK